MECRVNHTIYPLFTGTFTVRFEGLESPGFPRVDDIPDYAFLVVDEAGAGVVVDTGFNRSNVPGVGSTFTREASLEIPALLNSLGFQAVDIHAVVMTHLHWDHTGGMEHFPNARFYIQYFDLMQMLHLNPNEETYYCPDHWMGLLDRVEPVHGRYELKPGIELVRTGGHTHGHQAVRVHTAEGVVVLGGDAPFNYEFLWKAIPAEKWLLYKDGPGSRFYWKEGVLETLRDWVHSLNVDVPYVHEKMPLKDIQNLGDRVIFAHDPALKGVVRIPDLEN